MNSNARYFFKLKYRAEALYWDNMCSRRLESASNECAFCVISVVLINFNNI